MMFDQGLLIQAMVILTSVVLLISGISLCHWIFADSKKRGSEHPWTWVFLLLIFNVLTLVYYWWRRENIGQRTDPKTTGEKVAVTLGLTALVSLITIGVVPVVDVAIQLLILPLMVVLFPIFYMLVPWEEKTPTV